ncbi:hypothetical protein NQZ68_001175 [Dissostichus eleginoides]|nr:hypothetical protein NQZ68_001175 [Dissostichus eleginoides]
MFILVILGLLVCTEAQGISAGTPVFVLKGEDLLLNVTAADVLQESIAALGIFVVMRHDVPPAAGG